VTPELAGLLQRKLVALEERAPAAHRALCALPEPRRARALRVLLCSDFAARALIGQEGLLESLLADGSLDTTRRLADYQQQVADVARAAAGEEAAFMAGLRRLRQREMLRIAWRDLAGDASVEQTLLETSWFAESAIACATDFASDLVARRHGAPVGPDAGLVVLGMGKLGGGELNFSSDIDLIFLFAEGGETTGPVPIDYEEFYTRQGRTLIRLLDAPTQDGFVFRVDMRLRPFGDSGPLVASFASLEDYLQAHGRDWERYAYVKARALTGQQAFGPLRENVLRPFVYRRYLDFGVFDALREMKGLISRDVARRELANHVKLGPGGIREIEFIVQAFQLIRGGQDRSLRETSLLTVLPRLRGVKLLPGPTIEELARAYLFLRQLENRLQMVDDAQTHSMPSEPLAAERIAYAMGMPDAAALAVELDACRARVTRHFEAVVVAPAGALNGQGPDIAALWQVDGDRSALREQLSAAGLADPGEVLRLLDDLRGSPRIKRLDEVSRRRLERLLKCLLNDLPGDNTLPVLRRLLSIIEAIGQRSAYFALLLENTAARRRLIAVCGYGDFLSSRIAAHPLLLDELIDERVLEALPDRSQLAADLALRLAESADEDPDRQVESLCRFQRAAIFRVALADLSGRLPLMQVSDRLTEIAELITEEAMRMAWAQVTASLGVPLSADADGEVRQPVHVAAIGYGKFGGRELGYSSDLDLVFIHDSAGERQETDRPSPVDNQVFFLRYAQRLMHLLTFHSAAGRLYEVDVRLRPSGKGGMLVTSIAALRDYQFHEAWTWEHQALLHARSVAGDPGLRARFEALRLDVLCNAVRRDDLKAQVRDMRERMRRELAGGGKGFDLKQDRGGIADIEFLAQYWALLWTRDYPAIAMFPDTIRQLESVASAALVPQETVDRLVHAYQAYRAVGHHRSLDGLDNILPADAFGAERAGVTAIWEAAMQGTEGL
jgi:[glutamine synthetase] adenylyltransferase / [glutamine synthetase]-adenylyl-L-tyrosine phosphorylase